MNSSKDRILDAAERIVLRDGVSHLTLDAVAQETEMSKGGLLYHFRSKDDLIRGMIARLHDQFEAEVERLVVLDPNPVGRRVRAFLDAGFPTEPCSVKSRCDQIAASLVAAIATNPGLLDPIQEWAKRHHESLMQDELDPVTAMIVHLAADGLWTGDIFKTTYTSPELRERILARLRRMTYGNTEPPAQPAPEAPAKAATAATDVESA